MSSDSLPDVLLPELPHVHDDIDEFRRAHRAGDLLFTAKDMKAYGLTCFRAGAVPSSHVSDQSAALSDGGSGECVRAPVRDTECRGLDTPERVRFYEHDFYVLSNFSAFRLAWAGLDFDTSEAAYHWEKFPGYPNIRAGILGARSAHDAFKLGEAGKVFRRADWDAVKVDIMRGILRAKAEQHEYVRRKLLATGDRELVEDSWRDDFWGWGPNRDGMNMLGKLWMEVRAELRAEPAPTTASAPANSETDHPKASNESILREALARLVAKLDEIEAHPAYWDLFAELLIRGRPYTGPDYSAEKVAARSALAGIPLNASGDETGAHLGAVQRPRGTTE